MVTSLFDLPVDRRGSDSTKWGKFASNDRDVIGAWVADMDFPSDPRIIEAVKARLDEQVFGYAMTPRDFLPTIIDRLERKYGWKTREEWFVIQTGVVPSLFFASNCLGESGDGVMATRPNYHFFLETADYTGRIFQPVDCHLNHGRWEIDFDRMRNTITDRTRVFLLCNPYNPVGRVLDKNELETVADICLGNGTMICSDEIHAELVLDEDKHHIPIASLDPEIERNSITLMSASKAFNLPGIGGLSYAIIPNPEIRAAFENRCYGVATHPGALAYAATTTAFRDCDDWLADAIGYLRGNRDYLEQQIKRIGGLEMTHVEATFLAWMNVSESGLNNPVEAFLDHGVALSDGTNMGNSDFVRLNFACHRATLEEIIRRIELTMADICLS
jgi:cystathionine beta-lyase